MNNNINRKSSIFNEKNLIWAIILTLIILFFNKVSEILFPFVTALIFAYFLDPVVGKLEKYRISRTLATSIIILLFYFLLSIILVIILPLLYEQILRFAGKIPEYKLLVEERALPYFIRQIEKIDPSLVVRTKRILADFSGNLFRYVVTLLHNIWNSGVALIHILSLIFLTPIITFYLLRDFDVMTSRLKSYIPIRYVDTLNTQLAIINNTMSGYIRGQTNVCMIMAIYYATCLSILGLDFGLFIGLGTGLLTFIPYIGVLIGLFFASISAFFQFDEISKNFILVAIFIVGQLLEANVINPKLVGDRIGLHPVGMIFAMLAGGALFGFYGVLFATPIAAIINIILKYLLKKYQASELYQK